MSNKQTMIDKDQANKKIIVTREFDGSVEEVWRAWTDKDILDQWWAPKPWKAKTKSMDFRVGGVWLYAMVGPDGTEQWCKVDYKTIIPNREYSGSDAFCDENGNVTDLFPNMNWKVTFNGQGNSTVVVSEITFASEEDMNKIIEMGFEVGFTAAHGNLDEVLAK